jgi:hypothetical protein
MASRTGQQDGSVGAPPDVDGSTDDDLPLRDADTRGAGELPADTHTGAVRAWSGGIAVAVATAPTASTPSRV